MSRHGKINMKNAPRIIKEVLEIAPAAWLFGGTLLGPMRDGKIFPWDKDVDLGIDSSLVDDALLDRFRGAGFQISGIYRLEMMEMIRYVGSGAMGKYGKFILRKDGVKVEMCCFTPGIGRRWYYASGTPRFFVLPEDLIYPQKKIRIYDFEANIPENFEANLAFIYGADWRTPRPEWYFSIDHYLRREHTIIELRDDDGTRWSKWTGRKAIAANLGVEKFPADINEPFSL